MHERRPKNCVHRNIASMIHSTSMAAEMHLADVKPNQVTISILLKSLNSYSGEADVSKTMALINTMDEPMDEVLRECMNMNVHRSVTY